MLGQPRGEAAAEGCSLRSANWSTKKETHRERRRCEAAMLGVGLSIRLFRQMWATLVALRRGPLELLTESGHVT